MRPVRCTNHHYGEAANYSCIWARAVKRAPRNSYASTALAWLQHRVGVADFELARRLDVQRLDHAVDDQHRVALRAGAHARCRAVQCQAHRGRELGTAVGHHAHFAGGLLIASPCAHHEGVIDRQAPDLIDAGGLQRRRLVDIARHMLGRAGGGEGARQREDRNLLARGELVHVEGIWAERAATTFDFDEFLQFDGRQLVANFEHRASSWINKDGRSPVIQRFGRLADCEVGGLRRSRPSSPGESRPTTWSWKSAGSR